MKKFKKALLLVGVWAAIAAIAITGTIAYLTSEDSAVNVMTLGNVSIKQLEYERVVDDNGNWVESNYAGYGYTADEMQPFTPNKPAYPAVYQDGIVKWDDRVEDHQQPWSQIGAPGSNQLFDDSVKNVIDKFVFVQNDGESDAYYRTYIAIEWPEDLNDNLLHINFNGNARFTKTKLGFVEHEGVDYLVFEMLYNEILKPGEISRPSLLQVFLDPAATNEDCARFGETWEIIALSQAVQAEGFENAGDAMTAAADTVNPAKIALDTAFGEPMVINVQTSKEFVCDWIFGAITDYEAAQKDTWDGTASTDWYNDTDSEFIINTAEELAGFSKLVDEGNDFKGKTVKLGKDLDLYLLGADGEPVCFNPIGSYRFKGYFKGTFDGQNHTIFNLNQNSLALDNGYDYNDCGLGLFGYLNKATVKNLKIDGADILGDTALCGAIAAAAHNTTFENITVANANVADYEYYAGGIVGWGSGKLTLTDIKIDASTTIAGQWGDFNNANGGIAGGISATAEVLLKDSTIACRIDAFNDYVSAYRWGSYRRSGMIIGETNHDVEIDGTNYAAAPQLTCENVTVIYGDWANYTYCEFRAMGYPYVRVQEGLSVDGYSNIRYGHPIDANGNTVTDGTHVHNEGEDHNMLMAFDQLYGGPSGDRYHTYGTAAHEGVTVIYNNK